MRYDRTTTADTIKVLCFFFLSTQLKTYRRDCFAAGAEHKSRSKWLHPQPISWRVYLDTPKYQGTNIVLKLKIYYFFT